MEIKSLIVKRNKSSLKLRALPVFFEIIGFFLLLANIPTTGAAQKTAQQCWWWD